MAFFEYFLLPIALAMDCFTISITCGLIQKTINWKHTVFMAFLFGAFQGFMPIIGWMAFTCFRGYIEAYDHWIAFAILTIIGGRMIYNNLHHACTPCFDPDKIRTMIFLAFATSLDAMAVGLSFNAMKLYTIEQVWTLVLIIGVVSFLMSIIGKCLGVYIGRRIHWKAELVGGIILILIGIRIVVEHLGGCA